MSRVPPASKSSAGCAEATRQTGGPLGAALAAALCPVGPCDTSRVGHRGHWGNAMHRQKRLLPSVALDGRRGRRPWLPPGLFLLGTGCGAGDGCGTAFIAPVPGLPWASPRRVTAHLVVLGAIIAEELARPAVFNRADGAGTGDEERLERLGAVLALRGRPSRLGGVMESCQARAALCLEPRAHGVLVAVEPPGNRRDPPARRIPEDVVPALGEWWPGTTGLCSQGVCLGGEDKTKHGDSSPAGAYA